MISFDVLILNILSILSKKVSLKKLSCYILSIFFLLAPQGLLAETSDISDVELLLKPFRAGSDQVLVLYNADWRKDVDGSEPGQDSKEVAEYYVRMHTDPITGEKPYLLGLKCVHREKHLNQWVIREKSQDNKNGIVFVGKGKGPKSGEWARDSRHVEIVIDPGKLLIGWDSVEIWCRSDQNVEKKLVSPIISGIPRKKGRKFVYPDIEEDKARCYRFDAHELFKGTVWVIFKAKNRSGKLVRNLKLKYYDRDDFRFSLRGQDGIVDEKHFQEDVAIPVKQFLEDRANALPDGTLLKDHILYIVVCHGLPFSCEGVLGIERGVTSNTGDHGDLGSLEQRLQTLFYDWVRKIVPPVISMYMPGGPDSNKGVRNYRITTAMRYPLVGRRWNPYMHPDAYSFLARKKEVRFINIPHFPEVRKKISPFLFAYGVSRIDGKGPREAKRLIDYSLYASKFLRPEMDRSVRERLKKENKDKIEDLTERLKKAEKENRWGSDEQECLGFRVISSRKRQGILQGIPFLGRPPEDAIDGIGESKDEGNRNYSGFYPGGMDFTVHSSNGWNMGRSSPIWRQVDQGVTMSACGGPAYGGGPHITNATFWDNRILLRYLFRGRDLGECFLLSTYYINWSTSLLGDPLLHPDLSETVLDDTPPRVAGIEDIKIKLKPVMGKYSGTMTIPVISTKFDPEVAKLSVLYSKEGEDIEQTSHWPIYSTQPYVILRNLEPNTTYVYRPVLTDPYGNSTDLTKDFGRLSFRTGSINDEKTSQPSAPRVAKKRSKSWEIDLLRLRKLSEHGTIEVEFIAGENGLMPSIVSENLNLGIEKGQKETIGIFLAVGGPKRKWHLKSPLKEGEKAVLILRWRRFPLTREVLLQAKDGTEFTLAADVRTPWEQKKLRGSIIIKERNQVKILSAKIRDHALPASSEACRIMVPPVDEVAWRNANE
uniref:Uncharacterized protein n=2 Tax=Candidatus Methanogaster sp. ANME-2c ERB4 TaxID=2759911 RepID=A0A7G9YB62_9EURY|nr:hypothetical protein EANENNMH_00002 [Methanosarcinales archaeon ANME-2c ERB4]